MAAWPGETDLERWIGPDLVGANTSNFSDIIAGATAALVGMLDADKLPEDATDCPADLRLAILIYSHRLSTRPQSPNGLVAPAGGDFAVRLSKTDPDVYALIQQYTIDPLP